MSKKPKHTKSKKRATRAKQSTKPAKIEKVELEQPLEAVVSTPTKPKKSTKQTNKPSPKAPSQNDQVVRRVRVATLVLVFGITALAIFVAWPKAVVVTDAAQLAAVHQNYDNLLARIEKLQVKQDQMHRSVIDDGVLENAFDSIQTDTLNGRFISAKHTIQKLTKTVAAWEVDLAKRPVKPAPTFAPSGDNRAFVPILLYHHPPADLESQFRYLVDHGYRCVSLAQVAAAKSGGVGLPEKPVVITFDDGFEDQLAVLDLLKKYNLQAVYYIIDGGPGSGYHIGANRKVPDPQGGNDYLTWDQIRMLDKSGYVEIAAHTVDHLDLAAQNPEIQRAEIFDGKAQLEEQIGHTVTDFAYPYGQFNQITIDLVREAGFTTSVTTLPGTDQSAAGPFTLRRIRDTRVLP